MTTWCRLHEISLPSHLSSSTCKDRKTECVDWICSRTHSTLLRGYIDPSLCQTCSYEFLTNLTSSWWSLCSARSMDHHWLALRWYVVEQGSGSIRCHVSIQSKESRFLVCSWVVTPVMSVLRLGSEGECAIDSDDCQSCVSGGRGLASGTVVVTLERPVFRLEKSGSRQSFHCRQFETIRSSQWWAEEDVVTGYSFESRHDIPSTGVD